MKRNCLQLSWHLRKFSACELGEGWDEIIIHYTVINPLQRHHSDRNIHGAQDGDALLQEGCFQFKKSRMKIARKIGMITAENSHSGDFLEERGYSSLWEEIKKVCKLVTDCGIISRQNSRIFAQVQMQKRIWVVVTWAQRLGERNHT